MAADRDRIMSDELGKALHDAGVIDGDLSSYRRIVIDLQTERPVMVYADRYADSRWLGIVRTLDGVEVTTTPGPAAGNMTVEVPYLDGRPGEQINLTPRGGDATAAAAAGGLIGDQHDSRPACDRP